jgi:AP endonuclease-2
VSFFTFCKTKKQGYSGVATFTKVSCCPVLAEEGVTGTLVGSCNDIIGCYGDMDLSQSGLAALDLEGRAVMTEHKLETGESLVIVNVYCPRASVSEDGGKRMDFKMLFHRMLSERCHALVKAGKHVVLLGDMNAIHQSVDCCEPDMVRIRLLVLSTKVY